MRLWWRGSAFVLVLSAALTGCGGSGNDGPEKKPAAVAIPEKTVPTREIVIDNFAYNPATLTIAPNTRVTWINRDDVPHTATHTVKPRAFDSGALDTDERFSFVFTDRGTYEYFCAVHPKMTARIVVE